VTVEVSPALFLLTEAALQWHLRTGVFQVLCYFCRVIELEAVVAFQWAVELFAEVLQQVFPSFLKGERQLALLALKLVRVESLEYVPVDGFSGLEGALAVGAVAVLFQPLLNTFATEKGLASVLAALLLLLDRL